MLIFSFSCSNKEKPYIPKNNQAPVQKSDQTPITAQIKRYKPEILRVFDHDPDAYTQGLLFHNGYLYESTGQRGYSSLRKIDPETGNILNKIDVPSQYFAEGITVFNDNIYLLTWTSRICLVYDIDTFEEKARKSYYTQGWGIEKIDSALVISDGSNFLRFVNPDDFKITHTTGVYDGNRPVNFLNELELVGDTLYANVWQKDLIAMINYSTGDIIGWIDCSNLRQEIFGSENAEVLNGIAYNKNTGNFVLTGKFWPKYFEVKFIETE